ncbi:MAG: cation diffusion facilitator family transporter, partial [Verrucomicrobiota bacterium]
MTGNHDHAQRGHPHAVPNLNAAFAIGVALNAGFVIAEVIYGLAAHSLALISDAGHNLSDVFGLLIAWGATRLAKSLPTKHRTYGWRRSSILAALVNAIVLLIVVGGISAEAIRRIAHPEAVTGGTVIAVAGVGVIINTISALLFMAGRKRDLNIKGAFQHMAADAAVSLGVVLAGLTISATGWQWLDPAVSLAIGIVIISGTWGLLR